MGSSCVKCVKSDEKYEHVCCKKLNIEDLLIMKDDEKIYNVIDINISNKMMVCNTEINILIDYCLSDKIIFYKNSDLNINLRHMQMDRELMVKICDLYKKSNCRNFNLNMIFIINYECDLIIEDLFCNLYKNTNLNVLDLDLSFNCLGDENIKILSNGLSKISNLENLSVNLSNNNITPDGYKYLVSNLNTNLKYLYLRLNYNMKGEGNKIFKHLSNNIKKMEKLNFLYISVIQTRGTNSYLTNKVIVYIKRMIENSSNVNNMTFILYGNKICERGLNYLLNNSQVFKKLSGIFILYINKRKTLSTETLDKINEIIKNGNYKLFIS